MNWVNFLKLGGKLRRKAVNKEDFNIEKGLEEAVLRRSVSCGYYSIFNIAKQISGFAKDPRIDQSEKVQLEKFYEKKGNNNKEFRDISTKLNRLRQARNDCDYRSKENMKKMNLNRSEVKKLLKDAKDCLCLLKNNQIY